MECAAEWIWVGGLLLGAAYLSLMLLFVAAWMRIPVSSIEDYEGPFPTISVIVAARNEAANIGACLHSLALQDYPADRLEIIVVDDHSTDGTGAIVQTRGGDRVRLLRLAEHLAPEQEGHAFKKQAIALGVHMARHALVVTTDADCRAGPHWLRSLAMAQVPNDRQFVAGPVNFQDEKNALERFQSLDFLGMMLITGAGLRLGWLPMANGANLAYPKEVFKQVGGYAGVDHLASGDDLFLLHKIRERFPEGLTFVKQRAAVVYTRAKPNLRAFLRQRLRWATKNGSYRQYGLTAVLGVVFLLCWLILLLPLFAWWIAPSLWELFWGLLALKILADYILLSTAARFFKRTDLLRSFPLSQLFHLLYIAGIGLAANLVKEYEWKGRRVK